MPSRPSAMRYNTPLGEEHGRNRVFVDLAAQGRHILELGCADGFLSRHLVERGCRVTGVELDPEAAEHARAWCEKVVVADLNHAGWVDQVGRDFDSVLCGDVLEHLVSPERSLREISSLLAPNGRLIVCLPNVAYWRVRAGLLLGRLDYQPTGILDVTHLRFFTLRTARQLIEEAGYQVSSVHPIVGGGAVGRRLRLLFPKLFAVQTIFVAQKAPS